MNNNRSSKRVKDYVFVTNALACTLRVGKARPGRIQKARKAGYPGVNSICRRRGPSADTSVRGTCEQAMSRPPRRTPSATANIRIYVGSICYVCASR